MQTFTNYMNEADVDLYRVGSTVHFSGQPYRVVAFTTDPTTRQRRRGWGWEAVFIKATATIEPMQEGEAASTTASLSKESLMAYQNRILDDLEDETLAWQERRS